MTTKKELTIDVCQWGFDGEFYETSCKSTFCFSYQNEREKDFIYCPYCGKRIKEYKMYDDK